MSFCCTGSSHLSSFRCSPPSPGRGEHTSASSSAPLSSACSPHSSFSSHRFFPGPSVASAQKSVRCPGPPARSFRPTNGGSGSEGRRTGEEGVWCVLKAQPLFLPGLGICLCLSICLLFFLQQASAFRTSCPCSSPFSSTSVRWCRPSPASPSSSSSPSVRPIGAPSLQSAGSYLFFCFRQCRRFGF